MGSNTAKPTSFISWDRAWAVHVTGSSSVKLHSITSKLPRDAKHPWQERVSHSCIWMKQIQSGMRTILWWFFSHIKHEMGFFSTCAMISATQKTFYYSKRVWGLKACFTCPQSDDYAVRMHSADTCECHGQGPERGTGVRAAGQKGQVWLMGKYLIFPNMRD